MIVVHLVCEFWPVVLANDTNASSTENVQAPRSDVYQRLFSLSRLNPRQPGFWVCETCLVNSMVLPRKLEDLSDGMFRTWKHSLDDLTSPHCAQSKEALNMRNSRCLHTPPPFAKSRPSHGVYQSWSVCMLLVNQVVRNPSVRVPRIYNDQCHSNSQSCVFVQTRKQYVAQGLKLLKTGSDLLSYFQMELREHSLWRALLPCHTNAKRPYWFAWWTHSWSLRILSILCFKPPFSCSNRATVFVLMDYEMVLLKMVLPPTSSLLICCLLHGRLMVCQRKWHLFPRWILGRA